MRIRLKDNAGGLLELSYSYNGGAYQNVIADRDITKDNATCRCLRFGFAADRRQAPNVRNSLFPANPRNSGHVGGCQPKQATQIGSAPRLLAMYFPNGLVGHRDGAICCTTQRSQQCSSAHRPTGCILVLTGAETAEWAARVPERRA